MSITEIIVLMTIMETIAIYSEKETIPQLNTDDEMACNLVLRRI
jgi:hypothetical protein